MSAATNWLVLSPMTWNSWSDSSTSSLMPSALVFHLWSTWECPSMVSCMLASFAGGAFPSSHRFPCPASSRAIMPSPWPATVASLWRSSTKPQALMTSSWQLRRYRISLTQWSALPRGYRADVSAGRYRRGWRCRRSWTVAFLLGHGRDITASYRRVCWIGVPPQPGCRELPCLRQPGWRPPASGRCSPVPP